jgi:hypothetical protein
LYSGSVMIVRIVWSHVHPASTPALRSRCTNARSASSCVAKPLNGITGSSGRCGRVGNAPAAVAPIPSGTSAPESMPGCAGSSAPGSGCGRNEASDASLARTRAPCEAAPGAFGLLHAVSI